MGSLHVRTPKNFVLEERLERYGSAIETSPESYIGHWREAEASPLPAFILILAAERERTWQNVPKSSPIRSLSEPIKNPSA